MTLPTRAAIYARISHDSEGTGAGVARQVEDCRKLAANLGWQIGGEYVDNDISAYSGKRRPEYERMLSDLDDGQIDGVLVYHIDRLTRRPIELEHFLAVVDAAKVRHVRFVAGDADLNTGDGLLIARIMGAVAANESASKSRRLKRKAEQDAIEGKPHRGSTRPFGYEPDAVTIREHEAAIIRQLVARFLAGESTRSLATWLNGEQVPTVTGAEWGTTTLKGMLTNPRHAGLRTHKGVVVGPGRWEPTITEDDHRRVLAKYAEKKMSGRRTPQRYLLSGMVRCGKCGTRLYSSARQTKTGPARRYVCLSGPDHGGCGGLTIVADPLERLVADAVLYRLDSPELADVIAGRGSGDARSQDLTDVMDQAQQQLEELSLAYANRDISMPEWMTAKKPITQRLEQVERQLAQISRTTALNGLVGNGDDLRRDWQALSLSRQKAIVEAVVDHVVIGPGKPGAQVLDPSRVSLVWRH